MQLSFGRSRFQLLKRERDSIASVDPCAELIELGISLLKTELPVADILGDMMIDD